MGCSRHFICVDHSISIQLIADLDDNDLTRSTQIPCTYKGSFLPGWIVCWEKTNCNEYLYPVSGIFVMVNLHSRGLWTLSNRNQEIMVSTSNPVYEQHFSKSPDTQQTTNKITKSERCEDLLLHENKFHFISSLTTIEDIKFHSWHISDFRCIGWEPCLLTHSLQFGHRLSRKNNGNNVYWNVHYKE